MTGLCVNCEWLDQESRKRWDKAHKVLEVKRAEIVYQDAEGNPTWDNDPLPDFNARYAYCTNPRNKRQPKTDVVAGTHLDGAPWLACQEVRRLYPDCPDWKERQNEN